MPSRGGFRSMNWTETDSFKGASDMRSYDPSYFEFTKDTNFMFPSLIINDEMVPVGTAQPVCFNFQWSKNKKPFQQLLKQPQCSHASTGTWNSNDPENGIDVSNWITDSYQCKSNSCKDSCNKKEGWWASERCFTYKILTNICVVIKEVTDEFGRVNWEYLKGCFSEGPGKYAKGQPNQKYSFENVRIEVRDEMDPFVGTLEATNGDDAKFSTSLRSIRSLAVLLFFGFVVSAIAFALMFWRSKFQYKQME